MKQQRTVFYVIAAIILAFGLFLMIPNSLTGSDKEGTSQTGNVSYQGVEGKNALELLKERHSVETTSFDFGEMVNSIDGQASDGTTNFWAFYVNGEQASVGAGDYVTSDSDVIEWRLETIQL